jgi:hypothetical protein
VDKIVDNYILLWKTLLCKRSVDKIPQKNRLKHQNIAILCSFIIVGNPFFVFNRNTQRAGIKNQKTGRHRMLCICLFAK